MCFIFNGNRATASQFESLSACKGPAASERDRRHEASCACVVANSSLIPLQPQFGLPAEVCREARGKKGIGNHREPIPLSASEQAPISTPTFTPSNLQGPLRQAAEKATIGSQFLIRKAALYASVASSSTCTISYLKSRPITQSIIVFKS